MMRRTLTAFAKSALVGSLRLVIASQYQYAGPEEEHAKG